jgi:hypothetical protein
VPLAQHEFDALVSFDFNTGGIHRARLTHLLAAGRRAEAAEAFMGWSKPAEIVRRRRKEQALFRAGVYSSDGSAVLYPADAGGRVQWSRGRRVSLDHLLAAPPEPVPNHRKEPIMPWDTLQQLVRIAVQVLAGYLVANGHLTEDMATTLTGGVLSLAMVTWWWLWNGRRVG